jgi:hypothetical protein
LVFDKEELKKLIKEKGIGSTEDLNSFLRDVTLSKLCMTASLPLTLVTINIRNLNRVMSGFSKKTVQTKSGERSGSASRPGW